MIREYLTPKSKQVVINIPDEYINTGIELLIIPGYKTKNHNTSTQLSGMLKKNFKAAKNIRIPEEINIDRVMNEMNNVLS